MMMVGLRSNCVVEREMSDEDSFKFFERDVYEQTIAMTMMMCVCCVCCSSWTITRNKARNKEKEREIEC